MNPQSGIPKPGYGVSARNPCLLELAELSDSVYQNEDSRAVEWKNHDNPWLAASQPASGSLRLGVPVTGHVATSVRMALSTPSLAPRLQTISSPSSTVGKVIWKRTAKWWNRLGFYAALYQRELDGKLVLAFRGTDELLTDGLIDDAAIAAGGIPPQVAAAFEVARDAKLSGDIYVTGHSLGGALAIIGAARCGVPAVTFNAPGVMDSCIEANAVFPGAAGGIIKAVARCVSGARILNVRIPADPVSSYFTTGAQSGRRIELSAPECSVFNVKCRHGIGTCIEEIRKRSDAFDELKL